MHINVSDKAKPCPMCGSSQILMEMPKDSEYFYSLHIKCADCGLNGYMSFVTSRVPFNTGEQELLNYWNTRKES